MAQEANKIEWIVGTSGMVISLERKKRGTSEDSPFAPENSRYFMRVHLYFDQFNRKF